MLLDTRLGVAKTSAWTWLDAHATHVAAMVDEVWGFAELCYEEHQSAARLARALEEDGFDVQRGVAGMPTAFTAEWGRGEPVIGGLHGSRRTFGAV